MLSTLDKRIFLLIMKLLSSLQKTELPVYHPSGNSFDYQTDSHEQFSAALSFYSL